MSGYLGILLEELFEESAKTDFRDKFGEKTLQNFDKANQRLKNNGYSTDYGQYLKMSQEEIDNLILSLYDDKKDAQRKRIIKGEDKEIRGKYNYLGEKDGYKIYQPLDVQASMDLGINTGWCTTGRYGHAGHPDFTPSREDAKRHFNEYTEEYGVKLYYFLNPSTMYGEYAVALYPEMLDVNEEINGIYVSATNFELFNAEDYVDYNSMYKLPLDVIPNINIVSYKTGTATGYPESLELLSIEEAEELSESVRKSGEWWWLRSPGRYPSNAAVIDDSGDIYGRGYFVDSSYGAVCPVLKISNLESSNLELYEMYNVNNEYIGIYIGDNKFLYKGKAIHHRFDGESNDYEKSEIKQFLNNWLKELQSKSKDMKEFLNKGNDKMTLNEYKKSRRLKEEHIADKIKAGQDKKEMTRRAIKTLRNMGGNSKDLEKEFKDKYGHSVDENLKEDFYWDEEDSFFTRDDLDEFQAELEYELPEVVFHKTYFEPGNSLEVDWDYEGWEETTKVKVDMRRIRYPRDLIRRYAPIVIGMIKDSYEKMERELNESYLKEDWDSLRDLAEEMINYLNDNDVSWVDIYRINDDGPLSSITLEIDGDWKHDHLRANYLLNMKYGDRIKSIQDYSLEDTGSDWGKEAHVIRLK